MSELAPVLLLDDLVQGVHQLPPLLRDVGGHQPAIFGVPGPRHESRLFHPVQQACRIRHPAQQAAADLMPAEASRLSPSEDAENIVLGARYAERLEHALEAIRQHIGRPDEVQLSLLMKAPERLLLPQLVLEVGRHALILRVITMSVNGRHSDAPNIAARGPRKSGISWPAADPHSRPSKRKIVHAGT